VPRGGAGCVPPWPGDVVDIWCYRYAMPGDPALHARQQALLTDDELQRWQRFVHQKDRDRFLATRALVRTVLSFYEDVPPAAWRFVPDANGKPFVAAPATLYPLHFNLSNTDGLVVCAVSRTFALLGIDVEPIERKMHDAPALAEQLFTPREWAAWRSADDVSEPVERSFLPLWTLKEAYAKALGCGLSRPTDSYEFFRENAVDGGESIRLVDASRMHAEHWQLAQWLVGSTHWLSCAVDTLGGPCTWRRAHHVPLA
jgi:4'-phosphopantetheinyl transferase